MCIIYHSVLASLLSRLSHFVCEYSMIYYHKPAMECLPLVMEPESGFYADPVVVLDFQSLYPSTIIGYNLCFSTCLGKVTPSRETVLGVSCYAPDQKILMDLKQEILITPNGVMYVPDKVRKGVLPCLLEEILSTRIMIKKSNGEVINLTTGSAKELFHESQNEVEWIPSLVALIGCDPHQCGCICEGIMLSKHKIPMWFKFT
ncbi:DNA-directed DNA polymerase protein [Dioscorea alata]|uniref:DNA-directed DNA polymerase protein n=1 Tax=Dioscorea alata TaxID=55571 RepID=A0ACB7U645_DIOAL|nr:DNA-directed DNA polymerase protein [Dioscorea alata]